MRAAYEAFQGAGPEKVGRLCTRPLFLCCLLHPGQVLRCALSSTYQSSILVAGCMLLGPQSSPVLTSGSQGPLCGVLMQLS
jgi:hypothetical protein